MSTETLSRLLTVKEAMAALRVGRTLFYRLVKEGKIEIIRFGNRSTRVRVESVEKLMQHGIA